VSIYWRIVLSYISAVVAAALVVEIVEVAR